MRASDGDQYDGRQRPIDRENDIGFPNGDAYYAALRPDNAGNLIITFGYSDPSTYPSLGATAAIGPITGEQGGAFTSSSAMAIGTSPTVQRWGDYQAAAIDPQNPAVIWAAGQVADDWGTGHDYWWGTFLQAVAFGSAAPYVLAHQVDGGYTYRGHTAQRKNVTVRPSGTGSHVARASVTLRLKCRRHGYDTFAFPLSGERYAPVNVRTGRFTMGARFGADKYATAYSVTVTGTFATGPRDMVSGSASATEHSRTNGLCRARNVRFNAHD